MIEQAEEITGLYKTPIARILLAEDDRELRTMIARHLRRHRFEVVEARDGSSALTRLGDAICRCGSSYFDLLVSDIRMPGHTGLDLLSELRRCDWTMPVVLISAFGSPENHAEARRLGAVMLDKPIDLDALTSTIQRQIA